MKNQSIIVLWAISAAVLLASTFVGYKKGQTVDEFGIISDHHYTNNMMIYEDDDPKADPNMVGKWQNEQNPQWYKAYYDDYDGNGYFWGKEWDESEDVQEDDLTFHGNGWFRWNKNGKNLIELATMEMVDVGIKKEYIVKQKDVYSLQLTEKYYKEKVYQFKRIE